MKSIKKHTDNRSIFGLLAEYIVIIRYVLYGYKILHHRWRWHRNGELDIIASKNNSLIFIEVKARSSIKYLTVTSKQLHSIKKTIMFFLSKNGYYKDYSIRIDVAHVNAFFIPKVYKNAVFY